MHSSVWAAWMCWAGSSCPPTVIQAASSAHSIYWETVCLCTCCIFRSYFSPIICSWLQNKGFYLKLLWWKSLSRMPTFGVSIFASLSPLLWKSEIPGFGRMVTFVFPHSPCGLSLLPGSNHGKFHGESIVFLYKNVWTRCLCPCDKCHPGDRRLVGLYHLSQICQEDWGL